MTWPLLSNSSLSRTTVDCERQGPAPLANLAIVRGETPQPPTTRSMNANAILR
jgi:hypothetical protein